MLSMDSSHSVASGEERTAISMNAAAVIIAAIAVIVSVVSFEVNRRAAARTEQYSRMPLLLPRSPIQTGTLSIQNIGKGPALNIVIANASGDLLKADALSLDPTHESYKDMWTRFYHLEPIEAGGDRCYKWEFVGGLGLSYTDAFGTFYTTFTGRNGSRVVPARLMPEQALANLDFADRCDEVS
jgi:hypothetical protein